MEMEQETKNMKTSTRNDKVTMFVMDTDAIMKEDGVKEVQNCMYNVL